MINYHEKITKGKHYLKTIALALFHLLLLGSVLYSLLVYSTLLPFGSVGKNDATILMLIVGAFIVPMQMAALIFAFLHKILGGNYKNALLSFFAILSNLMLLTMAGFLLSKWIVGLTGLSVAIAVLFVQAMPVGRYIMQKRAEKTA